MVVTLAVIAALCVASTAVLWFMRPWGIINRINATASIAGALCSIIGVVALLTETSEEPGRWAANGMVMGTLWAFVSMAAWCAWVGKKILITRINARVNQNS